MNELQMRPMATDPVCGMQVNPDIASAQGLMTEHDGQTYYFCGRGCRLDFTDDPAKYLEEGYRPSM
jgi:YHS domain-containing protein